MTLIIRTLNIISLIKIILRITTLSIMTLNIIITISIMTIITTILS
jgi:hypothetical protein